MIVPTIQNKKLCVKKGEYITKNFSQSLNASEKQYPLTHQNINIDKLLLFYCIIVDSERNKCTLLCLCSLGLRVFRFSYIYFFRVSFHQPVNRSRLLES